jgi:hypothetical protein
LQEEARIRGEEFQNVCDKQRKKEGSWIAEYTYIHTHTLSLSISLSLSLFRVLLAFVCSLARRFSTVVRSIYQMNWSVWRTFTFVSTTLSEIASRCSVNTSSSPRNCSSWIHLK